jgi:antitoxin (DNA-binding transcriptional repressor) of toxin-antitoxin stability system
MDSIYERIVSVTELRRNFGELTANLAEIDSLILTRGGEPFAILKAVPAEKRKLLRKSGNY